MQLKLALPKGRLLPATASWLESRDWGLAEYREGSRAYRLHSPAFPHLLIKVFQEKDIPIQVAVGNYDIGICGRDWLEEYLARYPSMPLVKIGELGYGCGELLLASSYSSPFSSWDKLREDGRPLRLASEYPNLAEAMALRLRLKRFQVFSLWGAAQAYPPESADLVLVAQNSPDELAALGLRPLSTLFPITACLIANKRSWLEKDMAEVVAQLPPHMAEARERKILPATSVASLPLFHEGLLRLALPDGHQQSPTAAFLQRAGLDIGEYSHG
ncbi:MAG: ATP phosphoribosyltransferase, partial [Chloroflexota bacterium]